METDTTCGAVRYHACAFYNYGAGDPRQYCVCGQGEINLMPGVESKFAQKDKVFTGDYLMKAGIDVFTFNHNTSKVIEIISE